MRDKKQLIGVWKCETSDTWYPISWNNDGSFTSPKEEKAVDLTTNLYGN